jgi:hypothetical protein
MIIVIGLFTLLVQVFWFIFDIIIILIPFFITYLLQKKDDIYTIYTMIICIIIQSLFWISSQGYKLLSFKNHWFINIINSSSVNLDYWIYKYMLISSIISIILGVIVIFLYSKLKYIKHILVTIVLWITTWLYLYGGTTIWDSTRKIWFGLLFNNINNIKILWSKHFQDRYKINQYSRLGDNILEWDDALFNYKEKVSYDYYKK